MAILMSKSVFITGGCYGTGFAIAEKFAKEGYSVFVSGRDKSKSDAAAKAISEKYGVYAKGYQTSTFEQDEVCRIFEDISKNGHSIDSLVLNAANLGIGQNSLEVDIEDSANVYRINVLWNFMMAREAAKQMKESGGGSIVFITSNSAVRVKENRCAYCSSKSAILAPSGEEGAFDRFGVDNMRICRHNGKFYCFYIGFDGSGYRTAMAVSDDLLHWEKKGVVLDAGSGRPWDNSGRAISSLLCDTDIYGNRELIKHDGKYWMFYHAYPGVGYEVGAAANGIAWTTDEELLEWHCEETPVFEKGEDGCWDGGGLYSTWIVPHDGKYMLYYNGKDSTEWPWHEQVGIAFSDSFYNWKRYENNPVLKVTPNHWDSLFSCGQHVLYDSRNKRWVMFYCGLDESIGAQDGVAISDDMLNWEKCPEPIITVGKAGDIDSGCAHKPCIIYHNGMLWHFYCAVRLTETKEEKERYGKEYRCLTVARSKPF